MKQRTLEWFAARLGKATASRIADIVAKTKSGYAASRAKYEGQLISERLTGQASKSHTTAAMQWGIDTEPAARAAYEFFTDAEGVEVGFINHPTIEMSGASPDRLIGDDGLLEIKCPETHTHIDTLLSEKIPEKYIIQMQWQMCCAGRQWCDFVSFDPRLAPDMQLFIKRVHRDDKKIRELEKEVSRFLDEVAGKIYKLKEMHK